MEPKTSPSLRLSIGSMVQDDPKIESKDDRSRCGFAPKDGIAERLIPTLSMEASSPESSPSLVSPSSLAISMALLFFSSVYSSEKEDSLADGGEKIRGLE
jgi:hypothetical protein